MNKKPGSTIAGHLKSNMSTTTAKTFPPHTVSASGGLNDEFTKLKETAAVIQRIRVAAQNELEMARKLRTDAQRYRMETETRANSEAQQVILRTRLSVQKQVEEMIRQASEEIQKVLADIRMIRITASEELAAQRKFTDAARLCAMSMTILEDDHKPALQKKKTPATNKSAE